MERKRNMQEKIVEIVNNGLEERFVFGKMARHANGSVLYRQGKAVLLATVVLDDTPVEEPFLPLTVQYIEKAYAAAKIPGGFIKRESKPSDFETLTSRLVDRSLRPLFPKGFTYPVVITILVLSSDDEVDLQLAALHSASAALTVSDIPVEKVAAAVRLGKVDGEIVVNPSRSEMLESTLDLFVTGSGSDALMIEMASRPSEKLDAIEMQEIDIDMAMGPMPVMLSHQDANEVDEEELVDAISTAISAIERVSGSFSESFVPFAKEAFTPQLDEEGVDEWLLEYVRDGFADDIGKALDALSKSERGDSLAKISREAMERLSQEGREVDSRMVKRAVERCKREIVRSMILERGVRADGRRLDEVRPISIETNILPSVHGSCLFTRGETQVLATITIGGTKDGQMFEMLSDKSPRNEKFMVHYNFPGFSVGEAKPIGAPGRRELGHGNLAKRALEPTVDMEMGEAIRLVSEVTESNGSSSMATVCGGSLALCSAEVGVTDLVAGVAMGLVTEGDRYAILTDIMGLEDHDGDMDFKVAGTKNGITAMQMDIKADGLEMSVLSEALLQAKEARLHILSIMERAKENIVPSGALPSIEHFTIDPSSIVHIIGKAGSTIREIIEKFEVAIDLDREKGGVKITGHDREKVSAAREHIEEIADGGHRPKPLVNGRQYRGKIKKIMDYGMFIGMPNGADALLHISKISRKRVDNLRDIYREGEEIDVVVLDQHNGKIELATPDYLS
jgi:polyribonucleotide nucleotidyltransferase